MTWIKFALWLLGIYTAYYVLIILWDFMRTQHGTTLNEKHELTFSEDIQPVTALEGETENNGTVSPVTFSGGVSLKQLFNLALEESVEYTRAVSF